MSPALSEPARALEPSAARKALEMAAERRAAGHEVLRLYGSPHWLPPDHVLEAAERAVRDNDGAPAEGLAELREAFARRLGRENGISADGGQVLVTNAANHGLYVALTALLDAGDEVLTYSPHYYYQGIIQLAGGVPAYAQTAQEEGWAWDAGALERGIGERTKAIIVNTPTNPTGYMARAGDLEAIAELARAHDLWVLSDEAYDHTTYDGREHLSFAAVDDVADRALSVVSCTKSYAMRHWRMGFVVAPAAIFDKLRDVLEWNCFQCNHVAQRAALAAIEGPQEWVGEISDRFERCRALMVGALDGVEGLSFSRPEGGPFIFLNVGEVGEAPETFHRRLIDAGVATDPGGPFGSERHLRLPFGGEPEDVAEAGRRIAAAANEFAEGK